MLKVEGACLLACPACRSRESVAWMGNAAKLLAAMQASRGLTAVDARS
jgi:hypothetical protein